MKYIDADKIRTEIERRKGYISVTHFVEDLLSFLDTLEEPEQPTMGYDEAYLNEKIAKASKSWEGVDVDKFMDEVRGREPVSDELEDEIKKFIDEYGYERGEDKLLIAIVARHFAEWQKAKMMDEWLKDRDGCFWDGVNEGKKAMKEQMMKEAVEGEVVKDISNKLAVTAKNINLDGFRFGDKVKIIIVKEEEQ